MNLISGLVMPNRDPDEVLPRPSCRDEKHSSSVTETLSSTTIRANFVSKKAKLKDPDIQSPNRDEMKIDGENRAPPPVPLPPPSPPPPSLPAFDSPDQVALLRHIEESFFAQEREKQDLRLIITGGPGTGKTHFVHRLNDMAKKYGQAVVFLAPTGSASSDFPGGKTIHSFMGFSVDKADIDSKFGLQAFSPEMMILKKDLLPDHPIFVIDEMSMIRPIGLYHISERLKEFGDKTKDFGGFPIVFLGDPFQLGPNAPPGLVSALYDYLHKSKKTFHPLEVQALDLFMTLQMFDFKTQMRCDDPVHNLFLDALRDLTGNGPILTSAMIRSLYERILKPEDMANPDIAFAPNIVNNNEQRHLIIYMKVMLYGKYYQKPIFRWAKKVSKTKKGDHLSSTMCAAMRASNEEMLYDYFCEGASAMINDNLNSEKGVSNGTIGKLKSLTYIERLKPVQERLRQECLRLIANAKPGELVTLPMPPDYVDFEITFENDRIERNPEEYVSVEHRDMTDPDTGELNGKTLTICVIPLGLARFGKAANIKRPDRVLVYVTPFAFDLMFAITVNKVQGKTLKVLICDLNKNNIKPATVRNHSYNSFVFIYL